MDGQPDQLPLTVKTIGEHLQDADWATFAGGKWDAGILTKCWRNADEMLTGVGMLLTASC